MGEAQDVGLAVAQDFQQRAGLVFAGSVAAGGAREVVSDSPTSTPLRNRVISGSRVSGSMVSWPRSRARLAWWI
ncbi:hypothetical protein, partial [Pseudonocardia nigra]|uniref:hypothetical protein n=1 Tax=Pseudonocardia nigra TaxID=1921578 RepID=UPI003557FCA0